MHAPGGQRNCQPAGADTELQHRQGSELGGELGQKIDRGVDIADALVPLVVDVGERVAVRRVGVAIHRTIFDHSPLSAANGRA